MLRENSFLFLSKVEDFFANAVSSVLLTLFSSSDFYVQLQRFF